MENNHLERRADKATNDIYDVIRDLVSEVEELESVNRQLEETIEKLEELQKEGYELAFKDIVDGKQKLNAIKSFLENEYPDLNGNYFSDLSDQAQRRLTNHQLISYSELPENTKDEDVLRQFLRLNFTGVSQSEEHLNYIKSLL